MECFTKCGRRCSAVSEARTDLKNLPKVLWGKAVEDPDLKTLQVGQILSQPVGTDPSEGCAPAFEAEGFPFAQEFYSVIESRYRRFVSPFPHEARPDPVRVSIMIRVLPRRLSKLLQFEAQSSPVQSERIGERQLRRIAARVSLSLV